MTDATLAHIFRHPVKSAGWEEIEGCELSAGAALPFDRTWAVATQGAPFDGNPQGWEPKMRFLRGAAGGRLQAIRAEFDNATQRIRLHHPDQPPFDGILPDEGTALTRWLAPLWPHTRPAPSHLVTRRDGGALSDSPDPFVSILSLTSLRILSARMGIDLTMQRFRGNLWFDGLAPWEEFDLVGHRIQIGAAELDVVERIERCVATTIDTTTGHPLGDPLDALERGWDHRDFGVFARVTRSGPINTGDTLKVLT